ncbi:quinol:cytochrome C oxidoreductase [Lutimonas vermicola]|uniref:Quinol:cytochrome C oxidoreductase n=1 Tax=Lutimonas vermicola TaxID=414288 RepID=A0ABU9L3C2_9FLAO
MYTFSGKIKTVSLVLMIIGALSIGYGFFTAPKTTQDIEQALAHSEEGHHGDEAVQAEASAHDDAKEEAHDSDEAQNHLEHLLHQGQNRPWAAFFISAFFFLMISVCVLVFYAIQWAAQAGWSIVLFRIMEGISAFILPGSILLFVFLLLSAFHMNHIYVWMAEGTFDVTSENYDAIIAGKSWWLNTPGWLIRSFIYLFVYNIFMFMLRRNSLALDESGDIRIYKKNFNLSVAFIVVFGIFELFMSFDWLMSLDPHWYSQLYSFYVFASVLVSAITTIALVTIYLKGKGVLPFVNDSHIHDLAKYMFGFSIFWTYFFFDQFMLQWYANIPEEAAYFYPRLIGSYQLPFISMLVMNFVFPILILMNSDYKRIPWFVVAAGLVILTGHYIDIFQLISPATVGDSWSIGIPELGSLAFFLGLFIYVVFTAISKAPLLAKGNPFIKESEIYHY